MQVKVRSWRGLILLGILVGAMTSLGSRPGHVEPDRCDPSMTRSESHWTAMGGLRVVVDPETGQRLPESPSFPNAMQKHSRGFSRSTAGLLVVSRPDGSKHLDLQGRFRCGLAVRLGPDGPQMFCVGPETEMRETSPQAQALGVAAPEE